jgi:hypothetical protein
MLKKSAVWDGFPSDRSSEFSVVFFDAEGVRA